MIARAGIEVRGHHSGLECEPGIGTLGEPCCADTCGLSSLFPNKSQGGRSCSAVAVRGHQTASNLVFDWPHAVLVSGVPCKGRASGLTMPCHTNGGRGAGLAKSRDTDELLQARSGWRYLRPSGSVAWCRVVVCLMFAWSLVGVVRLPSLVAPLHKRSLHAARPPVSHSLFVSSPPSPLPPSPPTTTATAALPYSCRPCSTHRTS